MEFSKIQSIRRVAEQAFSALGLRDCACVHGLVMMDNTPKAREKKALPEFPQPIPSGMYKELLDEEDDPPGTLWSNLTAGIVLHSCQTMCISHMYDGD